MRIGKDTWVVLGILTAMIIGAVIFIYRGQGKKLDDLKAKITAGKATLKTQGLTVAVVPELIKQVGAMRSRYKNFDRRLPVRQELGGFLRDISGYLSDKQFSDQLIEPGSPTREELFHTLPIIMRFKGSYLPSVKFFGRIDEMPRLTRIQKLKIMRKPVKGEGKGKKGDEKLDIELQLNIYFTESKTNRSSHGRSGTDGET